MLATLCLLSAEHSVSNNFCSPVIHLEATSSLYALTVKCQPHFPFYQPNLLFFI